MIVAAEVLGHFSDFSTSVLTLGKPESFLVETVGCIIAVKLGGSTEFTCSDLLKDHCKEMAGELVFSFVRTALLFLQKFSVVLVLLH